MEHPNGTQNGLRTVVNVIRIPWTIIPAPTSRGGPFSLQPLMNELSKLDDWRIVVYKSMDLKGNSVLQFRIIYHNPYHSLELFAML